MIGILSGSLAVVVVVVVEEGVVVVVGDAFDLADKEGAGVILSEIRGVVVVNTDTEALLGDTLIPFAAD